MLPEKQQKIYNQHLRISRSCRDKPFKLRTDFSDFKDKTKIHILQRLEMFFNKFPNVNEEVYFKAPYLIWKDKDYFDLSFYLTPVATRAYTVYKKQLLEQDPDNDDNVEFVRQSLMFITKYCIEKHISLKEYYTLQTGVTYDWMKHIRQAKISPYICFGFDNIDDIIYQVPEDERDLLLGSFADKFYNYKQQYNKSKHIKHMVKTGLQKINEWIEQKNKQQSVENK